MHWHRIHWHLASAVLGCSGQSNMEFSVAEMFESEKWIANAQKRGLRLFAVQKNSTSTGRLSDVPDAQYTGGWVEASPYVSFIHFVSCKLEDTAGIIIALFSALMTIPAVIRTFVTLILC